MRSLKVENFLKKLELLFLSYSDIAKEKWVSIFSFSVALAFHIIIVLLGTKQYLGSPLHPERSNQTVQKLEEAIKKKNMRFVYIEDDPSIVSKLKPNPEAPLSDKDRIGSSPDGGKGKSWDPYSEGNSPVRRFSTPSMPKVIAKNNGSLQKEIKKGQSLKVKPSDSIGKKASELNKDESGESKEAFAGILKEDSDIKAPALNNGTNEFREKREGGLSSAIGQIMVESLKGGFRNTNASRLNRGEVSFETSGWDLGPYARIVQQKVESNWRIPAVQEILRQKGWTAVHFEIMKDGTIKNVRVEKSSRIPSYDQAAVNALISSSPLPPLPSFVTEEKISGTFRFFYNMWSEDDE